MSISADHRSNTQRGEVVVDFAKHLKGGAMSKEVAKKTDAEVVSKPMKITAVQIVDEGGAEALDMAGLPEEFKRAETLSGFPPSPKWENVGEALFGYFVTQRNDVGPNASRLYEIAVPRKDLEPLTVAVWGSAALDRLMDSAFPKIKSGDKLAIIFCGEKDTKRGLNPVKLFALKVVRPDGRTTATHAS